MLRSYSWLGPRGSLLAMLEIKTRSAILKTKDPYLLYYSLDLTIRYFNEIIRGGFINLCAKTMQFIKYDYHVGVMVKF